MGYWYWGVFCRYQLFCSWRLPSPSKSTISGKASEHFLSPDSAMPFAKAALTIDLSLSLINDIQEYDNTHDRRSFELPLNFQAQPWKGFSLQHSSETNKRQESAWLLGRWKSWCTNRWSWLLQEVAQDLHLYGFGWHAGGSLRCSRTQMAFRGSPSSQSQFIQASWKRQEKGCAERTNWLHHSPTNYVILPWGSQNVRTFVQTLSGTND